MLYLCFELSLFYARARTVLDAELDAAFEDGGSRLCGTVMDDST
jgi:hypothetical protein